MEAQDRTRMKELVQLLGEASRAYYQGTGELMSNFEYDRLYDELETLEKKTGLILSNSPTHKIGYEVVSSLPKIRHKEPMKSLDKTKDPQELLAWLGSHEALLSWKLDGLTVVLTYEGGRLVQAATRGNGEIGEEITANARTFKNLPLEIPCKGSLVIRGEAVISYKDFERINRDSDADAQYKNPRNLCSGSVRQLNSAVTAERGVRFLAYTLITDESIDFRDSLEEQWNFLKEQGFDVVEYRRVNAGNLLACLEEFSHKVKEFTYPVDGLVLALDSLSYAKSLGSTAKFPRHSLAFKWQDETEETTLREILWSTSRTGAINPVAVFDPVQLEGTTVQRASLHNVSMMEELELGIGDRIQVYKANMIIPQIAENLTRSGGAPLPAHCPRCGGETRVDEHENTRVLFCTNPNCPAKLLKSLVHFTSRQAMNIEGLSEMTLQRLIDREWISSFADLYRLPLHREELAAMDGFGEKSCENLLAAIEASRKPPLWRMLSGLGIPGVGAAGAKVLARQFREKLSALMEADEETIAETEGFGSVLAQEVAGYFRSPQTAEMLRDLLQYVTPQEKDGTAEGSLSGLTFVITGSLQHFENRDELKEKIEELGGKVAGSVSRNTSYLINNDTASTSSKNKKAKELGVPIISEEELMDRFLA